MAIWALSIADRINEISKQSLVFLILSFCSWFAAEQIWNLYEHVLRIDPYPSIADFFYIVAPIFMLIALVIFLKPIHDQIKKKYFGFAILVSSSILIPILLMIFQDNTEQKFFEITVAIVYPIVDAILLIPAILAIILSFKINKNSFWTLILIGIISFIIADNLYLISVNNDTYFDGHPIDILWLISYVTWNFAMYRLIQNSKSDKPKKYDNKETITSKIISKYGVIIILVSIIVTTSVILFTLNYYSSIEQSGNFILFFSLVLITLLIVFSSIIVILNLKLNNALDTKNVKIDNLTNELIKAERLSAIGELAARLSHDLRNPLNVIKSSIEISLLRNKESLSPKDHENIQRINNAVQRMTNQIDDVLDYVKTTELRKNQMSVKACLTNIVNELELNKINIKIPDNDISILADKNKLEIVFLNLIKNAIDAIGDNQGTIEIKYHDEENYVVIEVIDSGSGINEDNINKIFEPLYTTKQTGTGLGLVSCKNIIEQHRGEISVKNNPTTFTITLPK